MDEIVDLSPTKIDIKPTGKPINTKTNPIIKPDNNGSPKKFTGKSPRKPVLQISEESEEEEESESEEDEEEDEEVTRAGGKKDKNRFAADASNGLSCERMLYHIDKTHPRIVVKDKKTGKNRFIKHPVLETRTGAHLCLKQYRSSDFSPYGVGITLYF